MIDTTETVNLPDAVETRAPGAWRATNGEICRGPATALETRPAILGYLRRIGVYTGEWEGKTFSKLECDIQTNQGIERFNTTLADKTGKPTISSSLTFARDLLDCAKDEIVQIEATLSKKENKYGSFNTYVRVSRIDPITMKPKPSLPRDKDAPFDLHELNRLVEKLKEHPAYKEREPWTAPSTESAFDQLLAIAEKKGWPAVSDTVDGYLKLANKAFGKSLTDLRGLSDEEWGILADQCSKSSSVPKILAEAVKAKVETAPLEDDPFAEE